MSVLSQFFGGGGSSSGIESRILIVDGGKGAGTTSGGTGGNVYELNVYLNRGAVCPITVGYGGTSFTRNVAGVGTLGNYGSLSAFSDLLASCYAPVTCTPTGLCYLPQSNTSNYCYILQQNDTKQHVPTNTYTAGPLKGTGTEYVTDVPVTVNGSTPRYTSDGFYVGLNNLASYHAWRDATMRSKNYSSSINTNNCGCYEPACFELGSYASDGQFSGWVTDITGCLCVYGSGGLAGGGAAFPRVSSPYTTITTCQACARATNPALLCRCDVTYTGSGAGAPNIGAVVGAGTTIHGCPGIVVVQYPTYYAASITSSPNVCDCSPLTYGYWTYKFFCPGSITLP